MVGPDTLKAHYSALGVSAIMRYINRRFTYLLSYLRPPKASTLQARACGTGYRRTQLRRDMNFARFKRQLKTFLFGS